MPRCNHAAAIKQRATLPWPTAAASHAPPPPPPPPPPPSPPSTLSHMATPVTADSDQTACSLVARRSWSCRGTRAGKGDPAVAPDTVSRAYKLNHRIKYQRVRRAANRTCRGQIQDGYRASRIKGIKGDAAAAPDTDTDQQSPPHQPPAGLGAWACAKTTWTARASQPPPP